MVPVEVVRIHRPRTQRRNTIRRERLNIRPTTARRNRIRPNRPQQRHDILKRHHRLLHISRQRIHIRRARRRCSRTRRTTRPSRRTNRAIPHPQRLLRTSIHLNRRHLIADLVADHLAISPSTRAAILFIHPEHQPDRPLRLQPQLMDQRHRLIRRHNSRPVILRPLPHIPRINMPANRHHLLRMLAAHNLAHHIAGLDIGLHVRVHLQVHRHRPFLAQPLNHQRIFHRDRRRRNLRLLRVIQQRARVRNLHRQSGRRPHQHRHRTLRRSPRRPKRPVLRIHAIAMPPRVVHHNLPLHLLRRHRIESRKARHKHHRCRNPFLRRRHTHSQPEHMQRPRNRPGLPLVHHRARLTPPHPPRHHHRLHRHILQPGLAHQLRTPRNRRVQLRRSAQPLANVIAQIRQRRISVLIGLRRLQNLVRICLVLRRQRSRNPLHPRLRLRIRRAHLSKN